MKKLFFGALICIAFVGNTFAFNKAETKTSEKIDNEDACVTCPITITKYDKDGNITSSETKNYRVCTMTCEQAVKQVNDFFNTGTVIAP